MSIDERIKQIKSIMIDKGWSDSGNQGVVKIDASGAIISNNYSEEYIRDLKDACDIVDARAALAESPRCDGKCV